MRSRWHLGLSFRFATRCSIPDSFSVCRGSGEGVAYPVCMAMSTCRLRSTLLPVLRSAWYKKPPKESTDMKCALQHEDLNTLYQPSESAIFRRSDLIWWNVILQQRPLSGMCWWVNPVRGKSRGQSIFVLIFQGRHLICCILYSKCLYFKYVILKRFFQ